MMLIIPLLTIVVAHLIRGHQRQANIASQFIGAYSPLAIPQITAAKDMTPFKASSTEYRWKIKDKRKVVFYLPLTIERLVMSVQSGLDIGPAIEKIVSNPGFSNSVNPCDALFSRVLELNKSGLTLEEALQEVAEASHLAVIKHTFSHLAAAQRDGGEILRPLIELADATQLAYQEEMDEEIAKLPIKATLPLILTFSGLLICMMTPPILQVLGLISKGKT